MSFNDPISDMLTRIRNAVLAKKDSTDMPNSRMKEDIARVLKEEGYIDDFKVENISEAKKQIRIFFKPYSSPETVIHGLERVSKSGRRIFAQVNKIPNVIGGMGIAILSTSQGIMTDRQAKKKRLGGEILAKVW